jgi:hypothetical protein
MSSINHKKKVIFIHVPKTAGSSMESIKDIGGSGHENLHEIINKVPNFDEYFKWAFIRNPINRVASTFFNMKGHTELENKILSENNDLNSFVINIKKYIPSEIKYDNIVNGLDYCLHLLPLNYYILSEKTNLDFIGRYENISKDWGFISEKLNYRKTLPNLNVSKNKESYYKFYTKESIKIIEKIYQSDFEFY